jgi:hypothetical protein
MNRTDLPVHSSTLLKSDSFSADMYQGIWLGTRPSLRLRYLSRLSREFVAKYEKEVNL